MSLTPAERPADHEGVRKLLDRIFGKGQKIGIRSGSLFSRTHKPLTLLSEFICPC